MTCYEIGKRFMCLTVGLVGLLALGACGSNGGGGATPPATVSTITLTPPVPSILVAQTQQFVATAKDAAGNVITGQTFIWTSSNPAVASISSIGLATGLSAGATTITATSGTVTSTGITLTVALQTGTVSGRVVSAASGVGVASATVSAGSSTTTTAADGNYTLTANVGDRVVIHVEASTFAENFRVAQVVPGQTSTLGVQLLPVGITQLVTVAADTTVTVPNSTAQVILQANTLVPGTGGAAATTVNVAVTPVNPSLTVNVMPGDFTVTPADGGVPTQIDSFGALLTDIRDSNGTRYNLAPNSTATVRIPVGTRSPAPHPPTIPLFFFDESTGRWVQEGTATLAGVAPNQYYEGTVTHFSYWNADRVSETVFVTGCVRDAADQPISNALVETDGIDYSGSSSARTAADGSFRVAIRRGSLATVGAFDGTRLTNTATIGPYQADFTLLPPCLTISTATNGLSIKLTWGVSPSDLDSHMFVPNGNHVYFGAKGSLLNLPFVGLDVDDVTSFGPEVMTVTRLMQGTYQYLVHNFSRTFTPGITGSPARVELMRNGLPTLFVPPVGEGANQYWHVFNVVVDAQCQVTIVPVNAWLANPVPPVAIAATVCPAN